VENHGVLEGEVRDLECEMAGVVTCVGLHNLVRYGSLQRELTRGASLWTYVMKRKASRSVSG
jgi:hypothetical protein